MGAAIIACMALSGFGCVIIIIITIVLATQSKSKSTPIKNASTAGSLDGWTLIFEDEFDTPGMPDPSKWKYEIGKVRNGEEQSYTDNNARVEGGHLIIEARKDGDKITSASLLTKDTFKFTYGRLEVRAKVPLGKGTWPAIWTLGYGEWPNAGEIDVMEFVGYDSKAIHAAVHTAAFNHRDNTNENTRAYAMISKPEAFHIYAIEWYEDRIDFYLDGKKYFAFKNDGSGEAAWPFNKPQFILLNLAIGGSWGGIQGVDDSIFPAQYVIDYIRVYSPK